MPLIKLERAVLKRRPHLRIVVGKTGKRAKIGSAG
jgi:hypothetical protein